MMFAVRRKGCGSTGSHAQALSYYDWGGTVPRPHCRRVLYCVCSDDLCFMFGVTLLSLDVGHASVRAVPVRSASVASGASEFGGRWSPARSAPTRLETRECGVDCGETEKGVPCRSHMHTRTTRSLSLYRLHTLR